MEEDVRIDETKLATNDRLEQLQSELSLKDNQIDALKKELSKVKRLYEKANSYNDDLRKQIETLSKTILDKRTTNKSISIQATAEEIDEAATNENWVLASEKANLSVADCVRAAAEEVTRQAGFVYDEASGYYYDSASGYYYDAERALYYDANTGIYFFYNPETRAYEFHSQVDVSQFKQLQEANKPSSEATDEHSKDEVKIKSDSEKQSKKRKYKEINGNDSVGATPVISLNSSESSSEEGECSDSSDSEDEPKVVEELISEVSNESLEDGGPHWPPCVRAIVLETNILKLTIGSLFLVTCSGSIIGREKKCDICLPDYEISKAHATFSFVDTDKCYVVKDLGSQNGTFLNGVRLSEPKQPSENHVIKHDDIVEFGKTKLLLHVHKGAETCDNCEPGQVQAALAVANPPIKETVKILTKEEKEIERKRALKRIKKKFGLETSSYEDSAVTATNPSYQDRAKQRRHTKGSDNPYEKTEVASLDKAISVENKGFKMMQKMGWSSGETLGKSQTGLMEPIPVDGQVSKAGLGMNMPVATVSENMKDNKRREKWNKARKRYREVEQQQQIVENNDIL